MNAGRDDLVAKLTALGGIVPSDAADYAFMTALYRVLQSETVSPLPPRAALSLEMRPFYEALVLYLDKSVSKAKLDKADVSHPVSQTLVGLAYLRLNDPKKGLPLLRASLKSRSLGFTFVEAFARERLARELFKAKQPAEANRVLYAGLTSQFLNPIYRGLGFAGSWVGTFRYKVEANLDAYTEQGLQLQLSGRLSLTVDKQLKLKGEIVFLDGMKASLSGKVDKNGNATGTMKLLGDTYTFTGKLASPKCPGLADAGPLFQAMDSENRRLAIGCKAYSS
jgi:hypothetical protein